MYEVNNIVAIFHTGRFGETAVKFDDGWVFYSTYNDSEF